MLPMTKAQMMEDTKWLGQFCAFHEIGEYSIVEYKPKMFIDGTQKIPVEFDEESNFTPFLKGRRLNVSYGSLDEAIVGVIAFKYEGNSRAGQYFIKMIKQ